MESTELSKLRLKQVAVTNGLLLIGMTAFIIIVNFFTIKSSHYFFVLGIVILLQAVYGLIKGDSMKSFIPIFEKVANYEKQKMGKEWYKLRKTNYIWNLLLSAMMFLQAYWNRDSTDNILELELVFLFIFVFVILLMLNIGMIVHFRKVDRSTSDMDMRGYTLKTNIVAVVIGIVFTLATLVISLLYVLST